MHHYSLSWPVFVLLILLAACTPKAPPPGVIHDLLVLPQQSGRYVPVAFGETPLISADQQERLARSFLARHFSPWDEGFGVQTDDSDPFWGLKRYRDKEIYGENLLPLPASWIEDMTRQSAPEMYPLLVKPAVTVVAASLRVLPTHRPMFSNPASPGEGFPFDNLQNSLIPPGTPVLVVHVTVDGDWYLVMTPHVSGWVRPWEIAWVDQAFMDAHRASRLAAFVQDNKTLVSSQNLYVTQSRVGMLLPLAPHAALQGMIAVSAPVRRADGWAEWATALAPDSVVRPWPLEATRENYIRVLDNLLGQAYGWGGMFENRDCSALIQDINALFGVSMPRNSRAQATAGRVVPLDGLNGAGKEQRILDQGLPLRTIINLPGHVMLYLGPDPASGRPVVLHSIWGLRVKDLRFHAQPTSTPGRWVLGRTVITTLTPGAELPNLIQPQGLLLERVSSMTILGE